MAVYASDLVKLQFHGLIHDGPGGPVVDEFVHTLHLHLHKDTGADVDWPLATSLAATGARDRFVTAWTSGMQGLWPNTLNWDRVDAYHLAQSGLALHHAAAAFSSSAPPSGTATTSLPPEVALVVSLRGAPGLDIVPNPGRRRGRFYLPSPASTALSTTGQLSTAAQTTVRSWAGSFLEAVQGMPSDAEPLTTSHFDVVIASSVDGTVTQVGELRIGRTFDSQRRRRRSIAEDYSTRTVANH